ncbi:MAG: DUF6350 family protein [Propionibacteriaceae bacterium]|jgi:hypothetical protein|nr:DUF6350 family protein [Propionibacteriaceae bacterium]
MRTPSRRSKSAPSAALEVATLQAAPAPTPPGPLPWWLLAPGAALLTAGAGWAVVACPVVWGELAASSRVSAGGVGLATRLWLLAHGGPAVVDGLRLTLVPLLLTLLCGLMLRAGAGLAGRQAQLALVWRRHQGAAAPGISARGVSLQRVSTQGVSPSAVDVQGVSAAQRRRAAWAVAGLTAVAYSLAVSLVAWLTDPAGPGRWAGLGAALLGAVAGLIGAAPATGWRPRPPGPPWVRVLPRAVATALTILLLGGLAALATGLVAHREAVAALSAQLQPGVGGTIVLALAQVAFWPNLVVWAAAWTIGSGFSLGGDSLVVLSGQQLDAIPALPVIGALPTQATASGWTFLWLAAGLVAGGAAAVVVLRSRRRARYDETALVGGLAGALAGLVFAGLACLTRGDLGNHRLSGLGPLPLETLLLAPAVLGLSGLATGLVAGLLRAPGGDRGGAVEQVARQVTLWGGASPSSPRPDAPADAADDPLTSVPLTPTAPLDSFPSPTPRSDAAEPTALWPTTPPDSLPSPTPGSNAVGPTAPLDTATAGEPQSPGTAPTAGPTSAGPTSPPDSLSSPDPGSDAAKPTALWPTAPLEAATAVDPLPPLRFAARPGASRVGDPTVAMSSPFAADSPQPALDFEADPDHPDRPDYSN